MEKDRIPPPVARIASQECSKERAILVNSFMGKTSARFIYTVVSPQPKRAFRSIEGEVANSEELSGVLPSRSMISPPSSANCTGLISAFLNSSESLTHRVDGH